MNINETTKALALVQAFDNRTVGEVNVRAWHAILSDADAADVMEAIRLHYAERTDWIMPAHIRQSVRDIVRAREISPWAPGQYGVKREEALPELPQGERLTADDISPSVVELLSQLRSALPEVDRARVFPRQAAWDREQRAFQRSQGGEPNPAYRPTAAKSGTTCFNRKVHDPHPWAIEGDTFACPGVPTPPTCPFCAVSLEAVCPEHGESLASPDRLREICRAYGPHDSGTHVPGCPDRVVAGLCQVCGAESDDLAAHHADYPNGSCA